MTTKTITTVGLVFALLAAACANAEPGRFLGAIHGAFSDGGDVEVYELGTDRYELRSGEDRLGIVLEQDGGVLLSIHADTRFDARVTADGEVFFPGNEPTEHHVDALGRFVAGVGSWELEGEAAIERGDEGPNFIQSLGSSAVWGTLRLWDKVTDGITGPSQRERDRYAQNQRAERDRAERERAARAAECIAQRSLAIEESRIALADIRAQQTRRTCVRTIAAVACGAQTYELYAAGQSYTLNNTQYTCTVGSQRGYFTARELPRPLPQAGEYWVPGAGKS